MSIEFEKDDTVLFLGEGNYSFSRSLLQTLSFLPFVIATSFEPLDKCSKATLDNIKALQEANIGVIHEVDASNLQNHEKLRSLSFTKIIFMFPHVGGKMKIQKNRELLKNIGISIAKTFPLAEIIITLCAGQGGTPGDSILRKCESDTWQIVKMMSYGNLLLSHVDIFRPTLTYSSSGYRSLEKGFRVHEAVIHRFYKSEAFVKEFTGDFWTKISILLQNDSLVLRQIVNSFLRDCKGILDISMTKKIPFLDESQNVDVPQIVVVKRDFNTLDFNTFSCLTLIVSNKYRKEIEIILQQQLGFEIIVQEKGHNLYYDLESMIQKSSTLHWKQLWMTKQSIYPPLYSHDLSFWLSSQNNKLSKELLYSLLWNFGDFLVSFIWIGSFERNGRNGKTARITYQSYSTPLSPENCVFFHREILGKAFVKTFNVEIR